LYTASPEAPAMQLLMMISSDVNAKATTFRV
jgi:hypothetical protein